MVTSKETQVPIAVCVAELTANLSRHSCDETAWRDYGVLGNQCAGGDDGPFPNVGVVEDDCADSDQHCILDHAAVDGGVVADCTHFADDYRVNVTHTVQNGTILHVRTRAYADGVDIAA